MDETRETVRSKYGAIAEAESGGCCCSAQSCCGSASADDLVRAMGYTDEDVAVLPVGANMGLSCGNPTVLAELRDGEVVADLGSGGGFDAFIVGRHVGPSGRVIGVDMTPEMVSKARRNLPIYRQRAGLDNVEFRLGEIEHLPIADSSVDVVISNCVLNLSPDKPQVWREIARVLRPGGRVAISDLALLQPLPESVASMVEALVGCIAGAALIADTERMAAVAGLEDIAVERKGGYVEAMVASTDGLYAAVTRALPEGAKLSHYVASVCVRARKRQ